MAGLDRSSRDLYKFDGSHPVKWLEQMEKYFRSKYIYDCYTQLSMGEMYLDLERCKWWQEHQRSNGRFLTWDAFKKALIERFDRKSNLVDKIT